MKILFLVIMMPVALCADKFTDYLQMRITEINYSIYTYNDNYETEWGQLIYFIAQRQSFEEILQEYSAFMPDIAEIPRKMS